jgi:hypothetical protein
MGAGSYVMAFRQTGARAVPEISHYEAFAICGDFSV